MIEDYVSFYVNIKHQFDERSCKLWLLEIQIFGLLALSPSLSRTPARSSLSNFFCTLKPISSLNASLYISSAPFLQKGSLGILPFLGLPMARLILVIAFPLQSFLKDSYSLLLHCFSELFLYRKERALWCQNKNACSRVNNKEINSARLICYRTNARTSSIASKQLTALQFNFYLRSILQWQDRRRKKP